MRQSKGIYKYDYSTQLTNYTARDGEAFYYILAASEEEAVEKAREWRKEAKVYAG